MNSIRFRYKGEPHNLYVEIDEPRHSLNVVVMPRLTDQILCDELERIIRPVLESALYIVIDVHTEYNVVDEIRSVLYKEMKTNTYLRNAIELY